MFLKHHGSPHMDMGSFPSGTQIQNKVMQKAEVFIFVSIRTIRIKKKISSPIFLESPCQYPILTQKKHIQIRICQPICCLSPIICTFTIYVCLSCQLAFLCLVKKNFYQMHFSFAKKCKSRALCLPAIGFDAIIQFVHTVFL